MRRRLLAAALIICAATGFGHGPADAGGLRICRYDLTIDQPPPHHAGDVVTFHVEVITVAGPCKPGRALSTPVSVACGETYPAAYYEEHDISQPFTLGGSEVAVCYADGWLITRSGRIDLAVLTIPIGSNSPDPICLAEPP